MNQRFARTVFALLLLAVSLPAAVFAPRQAAAQDVQPAAPQLAAINAQLAADLAAATAPVSFLVVLKDQVDAATLVDASDLQAASALDKRAAVYTALADHARRTQAQLWRWLDAQGVEYHPHYLVNMIEVHGDAALATQLRRRPEVARLARNPNIDAAQAIPTPPGPWPPVVVSGVQMSQALPYGLTYTHADQLWAQGIKGQGIVVGGQDTGVQWDHPALRAAYRGWNATTSTASHPYNWFDAFGRDSLDLALGCSNDPQVPCDDNGHGTHTVGTMVGDATGDGGTILGMAPDARWIACRNMRNNVGNPASYTTCFEFFLAPYPQGGNPLTDGKPELGPQLINNSWGCPPNEGCDADSLRQIVDTVRAAGIFVVASTGNDGVLGCNSVLDPIAIYDSAFSIGAHDSAGSIAWFSSRGPVAVDGSQRLKPDLSAPGVNTYSAFKGSAYTALSGTSMAAPHVAGAVALLWSAEPRLIGDIDRTEQVLLKSAQPALTAQCGPDQTPRTPNYVFGYGRLDAAAAVALAQQPVLLTLTLKDAAGQLLSGRAVRLTDARTGYVYNGTTDALGQVAWGAGTTQGLLFAGTYQIGTDVTTCAPMTTIGQVELNPRQAKAVTVTTLAYCQILPQVLKP